MGRDAVLTAVVAWGQTLASKPLQTLVTLSDGHVETDECPAFRSHCCLSHNSGQRDDVMSGVRWSTARHVYKHAT